MIVCSPRHSAVYQQSDIRVRVIMYSGEGCGLIAGILTGHHACAINIYKSLSNRSDTKIFLSCEEDVDNEWGALYYMLLAFSGVKQQIF